MRLTLVIALISYHTVTNALECYDSSERLIGDACFSLVNERKNFYDAQRHCQHNMKTWSNLAVENNKSQMIFLTRYAKTDFDETTGWFWLGVLRMETNENFKTVTGLPLYWQNFKDINPSMNYVAARLADGSWDTKPLEEKLPFACSYVPLPRKQAREAESTSSNWLRESVYRSIDS
ncbi:CBN-CLEC-172 protein [Caenorhabditis brenneri]|uniref:CBN-CLEC-172 protein n=1 Tax=Caenorhabditis brenneri TaxID=135651 RepID=G0N6H9_CAEBE|nr:CBN-CLEC-172 protein [Caenorhabditis brenneri]